MKTTIKTAAFLLSIIGSVLSTNLIAREGFGDGNFEASSANGTFPDSGFWEKSWIGGEAGAVCTLTAGRSEHGLWVYTGASGADFWSGPYQELSCSAGKVYRAVAWVRTPRKQPWVKGSKASLQVKFLDAQGRELVRISTTPLTTSSTEWQRHGLVTCPTPKGTVKVQIVCYLEKPEGAEGQSIANFDDVYLGEMKAGEEPEASEKEEHNTASAPTR